jgi:hypothetical protein
MFFAIAASRVYEKMAAVAPKESIVVCAYFDAGDLSALPASLVAIGEAMPAAYVSVVLRTMTICKNCVYPFVCR